ncbi:4-alpha-glucanotransferase [Celerinatantimonas sp. YJH-8]|uniref:4-alpha-glucanotransferase n=1 Tax=Celerinatantimonas sp. YJH-8 TaxID=3228714 RepID=UPI0038BFC8D9
MVTPELNKLLDLHGITRHFIDAWGQPAEVAPDNLKALLTAMGYAVDHQSQLNQQIQHVLYEHWQHYLEPVICRRQGQSIEFLLRCPMNQPEGFDWVLETEQGQLFDGTVYPDQMVANEREQIDGKAMGAYWVVTGLQLDDGYHQLSIYQHGKSERLATSRYIVAPRRAYKPAAIEQGKKVWGVTVQLYSLRSERNWGIGDFTDLATLVGFIADGGGDFVGVNPLHALHPGWPENASPYSPSSRRWLNVIYIDVESIPEFVTSGACIEVQSASFQQRLSELRALDWVDYSAVMAVKLPMLERVFKQFNQLPDTHKRRGSFAQFYQQGGESLHAQATFDALQVMFCHQDGIDEHWRSWPSEFQNYTSQTTQQWALEHRDQVVFFAWLQWVANEQLEAAERVAEQKQMTIGLFCDVAVGVSSGSQEVWRNRSIYNLGCHVGAPPDVLGPLGQDWGLPPMDPSQMKAQRYQPLIDLFRRNMHACGALRIDHVMGLLRLWWIPVGKEARDGAYIQYPIDDLLAILVLESHRNRCLIVGEDLGTVPDGIFEVLQNNGIHSYRVFFFSQAPDGGYISPKHYPEQALAALTTHDMATLLGFWHCEDLKLGEKLGLYPDPEKLKQLFDQRLFCKQQILNSLHGHHSIPDFIGRDAAWVPMDQNLNHGMQLHMARGQSALLSLQLDDWLNMELPVNVPGTSQEYPNWRRKLSATLEALFSDPYILDLMKQLSEARREVSSHH